VNLPGPGERFFELGASIAAGDFDCDGYEELALGAPGDSLAEDAAGAVNVLRAAALFSDGFESGDTSAWDASTQSP
jgi:hypothetical protein